MDFTELKQFRSYQPEVPKDLPFLITSSSNVFNTDDDQEEFVKIINYLDKINNGRSLPNNLLNIRQPPSTHESNTSKSEQHSIESDQKTQHFQQKKQQSLSGIFLKSTQSVLKVQNNIKIFLQNSNQFLIYRFERNTLVKEVIGAVLLMFGVETANKYFKNNILNPEQYSLRMGSNEGRDLQPYSKIRIYNLNDVFLVNKTRKKSQGFSQPLLFQKFQIVITILNEQFAEIMKITVPIEDKLQKIYKKLERNRNFSTNKYLLTQNLQGEIELTKDMLIKQLTFPTIFIKARRFADETEEDKVKPFTLLIHNPNQANSLGPINITEASMYEQFEVVKLNKFGKQQERILGVDQMKIYNYQKRVRKYNKDVSLLGMIRGLDKVAGTKNPFMKIQDLLSLRQDPNECKLTLKFKDKQQVYYLKSTVTLAKLSRKLIFLVSYHSGCV